MILLFVVDKRIDGVGPADRGCAMLARRRIKGSLLGLDLLVILPEFQRAGSRIKDHVPQIEEERPFDKVHTTAKSIRKSPITGVPDADQSTTAPTAARIAPGVSIASPAQSLPVWHKNSEVLRRLVPHFVPQFFQSPSRFFALRHTWHRNFCKNAAPLYALYYARR